MKFSEKYNDIMEGLSFSKTFQAPNQEEKFKRVLEEAKKSKLSDGTWQIHGSLYLDGRDFTTLEGLNVSKVDESMICTRNKLSSFIGFPKEIGKHLIIDSNAFTSLVGIPKFGGNLICSRNKLKNLVGAPEKINGVLFCYSNNLESLQGCPKFIRGDFDFSYNNVSNLDYFPREVGGRIYCKVNAVQFTEDEIRAICKVDVNCEIFNF